MKNATTNTNSCDSACHLVKPAHPVARSRRPLAWAIFLAILCIGLLPSVLRAQSLFAHGNGDDLWIVRVTTDKNNTPQTVVRARLGAAARWSVLGSFPARPTALTSLGRDYVILLDNGDWFLGSSLGRSLPGGGRIVTLAGSASTLYAIGFVPGGMESLQSTTRPATAPATSPATTMATSAPAVTTAPAPRLVLFQLKLSTWSPLVQLPDEIIDQPLSLAVVEGRPWLAVRTTDNQLRIFRLDEANQLTEPAPFPTAFDATTFKLIEARSTPVLWSAAETGAGTFHFMTGESWSAPVDLSVNADLSQPTDRAVAAASERFRFYFVRDDKVEEQQFNLQGQPTGQLNALTEPANPNQPGPTSVLNLVFMMVLTFILFSTVRRRTEATTAAETTLSRNKLAIAPLVPRFLAGLIDAAPLLLGMVAYGPRLEEDPQFNLFSTQALPIWLGLVVYVVHTLTAELLVRRSVGKMVFGLQVVTPTGGTPRPIAIIIRNLLRPVEVVTLISLILLAYSPLRQRVADTLAQTVVVTRKTTQDTDHEEPADPD